MTGNDRIKPRITPASETNSNEAVAASSLMRRSNANHKARVVNAVKRLERTRSKNVNLMFAHIFLFTIYQSVCQWNLFDAYLSFLARENGFKNSNTWVGFAEGISGVTTLFLAVPLGILVDSINRVKMVQIAGCIGLVATAITAYAFRFDNLVTLYTNLFLWGLFTGIQGTAAEAIFADSIEKGKRSEKFTIKAVLNTCGLSLGPFLMLGMFLTLGNNWSLQDLHRPLLVGCVFAPIACIPLFLMRDPRPNIELSQIPIAPSPSPRILATPSLRTPLLSSVRVTPLVVPSTPVLRRDRLGSTFSDYSEVKDEYSLLLPASSSDRNLEDERFANMTPGEKWIPFFITLADLVTEIGAGMTVRFFPLFFIKDYGVSPVALCSIFCVYPLCVSIAMPICQKISTYVGRAQASFAFQCAGISMLFLMTTVTNLPSLIVVFMIRELMIEINSFRGMLQNAAYPVDRSILMDYIPSKHRGKWNSIASLTTMTWSGSAVIGGYLADSHDYRFTFLITAAVYAVGTSTYIPLLYLVPRVESECGPKSGKTPKMGPEVSHKSDVDSVVTKQIVVTSV